jgi:hypothetical protein
LGPDAEYKFWNGRVGVFAGIKNLFDEDYWGEVRDEGIVPHIGAIITAASKCFSKSHPAGVGNSAVTAAPPH